MGEIMENEQGPRKSGANWLLNLLMLAIILGLGFSYWQTSKRLDGLENKLTGIEKTISDVPQSTIDAIIAMQDGALAQGGARPGAQEKSGPRKISLTAEELIGNPDAKIAIVEFSDFNCPYCARFHAETLPQIIKNYVDSGDAVFVYRDYIGVGGNVSLDAALAAECAREQISNKQYYELIRQIYAEPGRKNQAKVIELADKMGLNMDTLNACIKDDHTRQNVIEDTRLGQTSGIRGTPGFVVGTFENGVVEGSVISGAQPYALFESYLEKLKNSEQ